MIRLLSLMDCHADFRHPPLARRLMCDAIYCRFLSLVASLLVLLMPTDAQTPPTESRARKQWPFFVVMGTLGGSYVVLIAVMLLGDLFFTTPGHVRDALTKPEIVAALRLTFLTCTVSAVLSLWVATPLGYLLSRFRFRGRWLVDTLVDIPVVLPPLVLGLSLLIVFHIRIGPWQLEEWLRTSVGWQITYAVPAVVLAQFSVACAFAVRTMRVTFDQISPRAEQVARTLGCLRGQAFLQVALPQAGRGLTTAFTLAWARSLGEFGPILVFAGATRMRTEVLSTSVFLELSVGNLESAVAVSLLMVAMAGVVLMVLRLLGQEGSA